jgi:hypothetical protein
MMENLMKIEVLGENLSQRHFVHHKPHLPDPGSNTGRRDGKPATNRLSYGAALISIYTVSVGANVPQWKYSGQLYH